MKASRKVTRMGVVMGGVTALLATGAAMPAHASRVGSACDWTGCSETINQSTYSVYVARDWCSAGVCPHTSAHPRRWIAPGSRTPAGQDWDGFRVDAGWCYQVYWKPQHAWRIYDRRGKGALWVKVANPEEATVVFQSRTKCYP